MDRDVKRMMIIFVAGLIGIILAALELALYNAGIYVDELVISSNTVSITDIMAITVVSATIGGVVIAVNE